MVKGLLYWDICFPDNEHIELASSQIECFKKIKETIRSQNM